LIQGFIHTTRDEGSIKLQSSTKAVSMASQYAHKEDNGGRRSSINRRQFNYAAHIPERRSFPDRRSRQNRREAGRRPPARRLGHSSTHGSIIPFPTERTGD